jgi:ketosteroid isomerase-like protein
MVEEPSQRSAATAAYAALVQQFGDGWQQGSADRIVDVFTPDAVFVPGPFEPPARGHAAIHGYWRDVPMEQADIAFRFGEIFVVGPWFATEFKVTFRRRRTGQPVVVKGALFCETADGKISEMRMYWERSVRPR